MHSDTGSLPPNAPLPSTASRRRDASARRRLGLGLFLAASFLFVGCGGDARGPDTDAVSQPIDATTASGSQTSTTPPGGAGTCAGDPGLDPLTGCTTCQRGYHELQRGDEDLAAYGAAPDKGGFECVRDATCDELRCGAHGTCVAGETGAACVCAPGFAGDQCASCAPLYQPTEGGACVLGEQCSERLCGGHGSCVVDAAGEVGCRCDTGWDIDAQCGGRSIALGGPEEAVASGARTRLHVGLRNGATCAGGFVWSADRGSVQPDAGDSTWATYAAPAAGAKTSRASVRAVCADDRGLATSRDVLLAGAGSDLRTPPRVSGSCPEELAREIDPVMLDWMEANGIAGGTIGVSIFGGPVCMRAYGYSSLGTSADGARGVEAMRTCTPMRLASVTKTFTRAAMRGNLYGTSLPASMGGGTLGATTPLLPIVDTAMGLGAGNAPAWNESAALYSAGWAATLPDSHCTPGSAAIDPAWTAATVHGALQHRAGFQPNQSYFPGSTTSCTNEQGCKVFNAVSDPTVATGPSVRIANDLGLNHGVPSINDVMAWMGGVCMYETQATNLRLYSNFGYSVVGRAVELISGQPYENYVLDFLEDGHAIDRTFAAAGRPIVYQGHNLGDGPGGFALPSYMREARYYSHLGKLTDITQATKKGDTWVFPGSVDAPYGGANYNLMYAHGGLVANTLGLLNFAREYELSDGKKRPKILLPVHDDTTRGSQGGLLWGTSTQLSELDDDEPKNAQGIGCYVASDTINDLSQLSLQSCPLPHGVTMAVLFNGDPLAQGQRGYVAGRHSTAVLQQGLRLAFSRFSPTLEPWLYALRTQDELSEGCEEKCPAGSPFCTSIDCGDGDIDGDEKCDDGNNVDDDGCEHNCVPTPLDPQSPPSYQKCAGMKPGDCLGGPCGDRDGLITDSGLLDENSALHPDGDFSPDKQCADLLSGGGGEVEQAVCHREVWGGKAWGVCRECGVDTMIGCLCPAPNAEDGGCNGVAEEGLSCVGGRCWKDLPPSWMCQADCKSIYGKSGYCRHDSLKGAVCYDQLCSEPVDGYCDIEQEGQVCNSGPTSCKDGSCCEPECLDDQDCEDRHYKGFHCTAQQRCVL